MPQLKAQAGKEFVQNGSFENELAGWEKTGKGSCPIEIFEVTLPDGTKGNALRAKPVREVGQGAWDNNLVNKLNDSIPAGQLLALSFWARSPDGGKAHISLQPFHAAENPLWAKDVPLSSEWEHFEFTVPVQQSSEEGHARLQFALGYATSTIEIALPSLRIAQ